MNPLIFNTIIIGSGLGGLTTGARLATHGKNVLIIEQHAVPGGCATTYKRGDFTFEVSLHEMDGLDEIDAKQTIFKKLGVFDNVKFLPVPEFYRFINGRVDIVIPHETDKAIQALIDRFPREEAGIKKYFKTVHAIRKELLNLPQSALGWIAAIPLIPFKYATVLRNLNTNVGDFLDSIITDEDLKFTLLGNLGYYHDDPYTLSMLYYAAGQGSYFSGGGHYIQGGSQKLSNHLANVISSNGGTVLTGHTVTRIITHNGKAIGVEYRPTRDTNAPTITAYASNIVANAAIPNVVKMLDQPEQDKLSARVGHLKPASALACIYIGFKQPVKNLGNKNYSTFVYDPSVKKISDLVDNMHADINTRAFVFTDYSQIDAQLTPADKSVGSVCILDYLSDWENLSPDAYKDKKERFAQVIFDRLEQIIPGFKDNIQMYEVCTPITLKHFTCSPYGNVYGYAQTPEQAGIHRLPAKSPIRNLYFASAWAMPGGGYSGVIWGGWMCAQDILRKK